jgi:tripartite-type tricarboxylate transporter receptor subunit TctC
MEGLLGTAVRIGTKFALCLAAWAFAGGAAADYAERPIRLIVPHAAGSATDNVARILGAELAKQIGQQIVVENRPGGALTIGIDAVAKAPSRRSFARTPPSGRRS